MLAAVGVHTRAELDALGSVAVYLAVRRTHRASINLLYALEAALRGIDWRDLPASTRSRLRAEVRV